MYLISLLPEISCVPFVAVLCVLENDKGMCSFIILLICVLTLFASNHSWLLEWQLYLKRPVWLQLQMQLSQFLCCLSVLSTSCSHWHEVIEPCIDPVDPGWEMKLYRAPHDFKVNNKTPESPVCKPELLVLNRQWS